MRIERVLAANPGPFTGAGTNTWLLESQGEVIVIDPGPIDTGHAEALATAVGTREVTGVLVTHTHEDHAPLANPLAADWGVPACGHAPGPGFEPDMLLADGSVLSVGAVNLDVVHTPGHSDDHLCFRAGTVLFTGDHIMGGSSVMVEEMGQYMRSLERLRSLELSRLYPGHGEAMDDPAAVIDWYLAHRRQREKQILQSIGRGATTVPEIVEDVYRETDSSLHPLAARSVSAHIEKLASEGLVAVDGRLVRARGSAAE